MFITPAGYENEEGSGGEFNSRVSWNSTRLRMAKDVDDVKEALEDQATRLGR